MATDLLSDALAKASPTPAPPATLDDLPESLASPPHSRDLLEVTPHPRALLDVIVGVDLEVILDGVRMTLHFGPGVDPMAILPGLKEADPNVQTHSQFWSKGGGSRDTKIAICVQVSLRIATTGAFIDLVCSLPDGSEDYAVRVSKKNSASFAAAIRGLGRLTEAHLEKIDRAFDEKRGSTDVVRLGESECFGVAFFTTDDGQHFLDTMTPEPPKAGDKTNQEGTKTNATDAS